MLVIGVRNKILKTEGIPDACPVCKASNCLKMTVYLQYAAVFWIPFAPSAKKGISVCDNCKATLQLQYMSPAFQDIYKRIKADTKNPLWTFTGAAIALIGLVVFIFLFIANSQNVAKMVGSPKVNDIFELRSKSGNYTLYKVKKIGHDTVYFYPNKLETTEATGLNELYDKGTSGFETSTTYGIPLTRLKQMNKAGDILDVKRY